MAALSGGADPFSLADPSAGTEILGAARFADVDFTDVREPVYYGPDVAAALDWGPRLHLHQRSAEEAGFRRRSACGHRLDDALAAHASDDGVWFNTRAWIVTARRHGAGTQPHSVR